MPELMLYHAPGACAKVNLNALEECGPDYARDIAEVEAAGFDLPKGFSVV